MFLLIITRRSATSAMLKQRPRCLGASVQKAVHRIIWTSCLISALAKNGVSAYEALTAAFAGNAEIVLQ